MPFPPDIIWRLTARDPHVLDTVLEEFGPPIRIRLEIRFRGTLRRDEIEDVLMTAVEHVWTHGGQFDPDKGTLRSWFETIAWNTARNMAKSSWRQMRKLEREVDPEVLESMPCSAASAPSAAVEEADETTRAVRAALRRLPETQRQILEADMNSPRGTADARELGKELGMNSHAVRAYRRRAHTQIKEILLQDSFPASGEGGAGAEPHAS